MQAHTEACTALVFSPIGDIIATGGADKIVNLWNTKNMQSKASFKSKQTICALAFSLDNNHLMSCSTDNKASMYSLKTMKPVHTFTPHQDLITSAKFCFSTKHVITSSLD